MGRSNCVAPQAHLPAPLRAERTPHARAHLTRCHAGPARQTSRLPRATAGQVPAAISAPRQPPGPARRGQPFPFKRTRVLSRSSPFPCSLPKNPSRRCSPCSAAQRPAPPWPHCSAAPQALQTPATVLPWHQEAPRSHHLRPRPVCAPNFGPNPAAGEPGSVPLPNSGDPPAVLTLLLGSQSISALARGEPGARRNPQHPPPRVPSSSAAGHRRRPPAPGSFFDPTPR